MASKKAKCSLHSPLLSKDSGLFLLWKRSYQSSKI